MLTISVYSFSEAASFAASELKKYLRMMMPRVGNVRILPNHDETASFRLGLMADFRLDCSDAADLRLDDVVFIDCDEAGGVIAGSNPGALVIAVYRYLKFCGCRWLFPGLDGERIPRLETLPAVSYRKMADYRYRGQCNEGAESQRCMMETIELTPKLAMNSYMLEFDVPTAYYHWYYNHINNTVRTPEPVSADTILRWKRLCETEIELRGLSFHDMGHGWTAESFGISSKDIWEPEEETYVPPESVQYLALVKGKRALYHGVALNTNSCFSNPEARAKIASYVADYAEKQNNVDFLHIWLADATHNHCECELCRTRRVSDWYVMLLNEIDAELTRRELATKLVFIAYTDTMWPPETERIANPKRFTMLFAPIHRTYCETYEEPADETAIKPYVLNDNSYPQNMAECMGYLAAWKRVWDGDAFCYEYHFWQQQFLDVGGMYHARLLFDDIRGLRRHGLDGIIEDGSQRSYFPSGFSWYVYGETLFDSSRSFEELTEEYFSAAYGSDWRIVVDWLQSVSDQLDLAYVSGNRKFPQPDGSMAAYVSEEYAQRAEVILARADAFGEIIADHIRADERCESAAWQLLGLHREFLMLLCPVIAARARNDLDAAKEAFVKMQDELSAKEVAFEACFDEYSCIKSLNRLHW